MISTLTWHIFIIENQQLVLHTLTKSVCNTGRGVADDGLVTWYIFFTPWKLTRVDLKWDQ